MKPEYQDAAITKTIEDLRSLAPKDTIVVPKGVVVGLLQSIQDARDGLQFAMARAKTKKDKVSISSAIMQLEGPRDRLLRVVRGESL